MRFPTSVSLVVALAAAGLAGFSAAHGAQIQQGPLFGKKAPEFHVQGIYNEAYSLETFKGHILVMQFGSSW